MNPGGRGLVENEEQGKNKKMKLTVVVEEQEQEQEKGSETRFVDLDEDTLHNVLKRVDEVTLGRAACVNKLWRKAAKDGRLWEPFLIRLLAKTGMLHNMDRIINIGKKESPRRKYVFHIGWQLFHRMYGKNLVPVSNFYSIDPQVFSSQIGPWV